MKAALMNGKAIAEEVKASLRERVEVLQASHQAPDWARS